MTKPLVLKSIETDDGLRCVDIFRRQDLSFGFEEYRRDPEDSRGWQLAGGYSEQRYQTQDQALDSAMACVPWLRKASLSTRS
ncbi:MAG: hypothetical protein CBC34_003840 [Hyphomicrobiaceae bacterium TMED74]|nr:hypothetical protein [Filomicrobium sp.]RPG45743.1 MAG: hypothetical protein CBC34_003840 [Hyphomicrobiaceae bacterium TMED74]